MEGQVLLKAAACLHLHCSLRHRILKGNLGECMFVSQGPNYSGSVH